MSAPRYVDCKCSHPKSDHDALAPQCSAIGCTCLRYFPASATAARVGVVSTLPRPVEPDLSVRGERGPTIEQVLQAGRRSEFARTVKLAEKIALSIHDLRGRLTDERHAAEEKRLAEAGRAEARREVERLEAALRDARAKLKKPGLCDPSAAERRPVSPSGDHPCSRPDCDRTFASAQARAMHERRAHDGFNPNASKAATA